jgi:hypothetical protein
LFGGLEFAARREWGGKGVKADIGSLEREVAKTRKTADCGDIAVGLIRILKDIGFFGFNQ